MSDVSANVPQATPGPDVVCVIVTYAERRALLRTVLDALPAQGVRRVVVVDNGAHWPVRAELAASYGDFVDVVEMGHNTGSAPGYAAGIQCALDLGAEFIFLLDDDNKPERGALPILLKAYAELARNTPRDRLAVLAFRPPHQSDVAAGVPLHRINPRPSSFLGFHVLDIPYKLWRRTSWGRPRGPMPGLVQLSVGPYSGLLFKRDLVTAIGLPNPALVLYIDDTEFTWRITANGGRIVLITSARLVDLESSWNTKAQFSTSMAGWLDGSGDFRAYYGMRNRAYFDARYLCRHTPVFMLNQGIYLILLWCLAQRHRRQARYWLLLKAMDDGLAEQLGVHPEFPL